MSKTERVQTLMARPIHWPCSREAVEMIATEEDCRLVAYQCSAGVWTIGWGETDGVRPGMRWTQEHADERFRQSLQEWQEGVVVALAGAYANEHQLAAMLCLAYNIGLAGFRGSTVRKRHVAGDYAGAARAFGLWDKVRNQSTGKLEPSAGLTARRAREAALYLQPTDDQPEVLMPQAVQSESRLAASPIAQAGAATAGAGTLQLLSAAGDGAGKVGVMLQQAKQVAVETVGVPTDMAVPAILLVAGVVVLWWRWQQRKQGWA